VRALHPENTECLQCKGMDRVPMHHVSEGLGMPRCGG
jgi:hypothetical protein